MTKSIKLCVLCILCVIFATPALQGCASTTQAVVACGTTEGKRLAEAAGDELATLWGRDKAAWLARAAELARIHGRSFLYCVADALGARPLALAGAVANTQPEHARSLRALAGSAL